MKPSKINIRRVESLDMEALIEWRLRAIREIHRLPQSYDMTLLRDANLEYYRENLPTGDHIACFSYSRTKITGIGGLCLSRKIPTPDNPTGIYATIVNVYVSPKRRNRGIAHAIVRWLIDQARERGITKIRIDAEIEARRLFESIGFVSNNDALVLNLSTDIK